MVVLIKSGIFIETFDKDAIIINKLLGYKLMNNNNNIRLGFSNKALNKVLLELRDNHINYVLIDNGCIDRKKYKDNNYNISINNYKSFVDIDNRINIIYNRLKSLREDNNISNILSCIEKGFIIGIGKNIKIWC